MKKALIFLLIEFLISNCSNDNDISNQIVGNWKLTEAKFYGLEGEDSIDYSNKNINYNFKSNGILVVSGGDNAGYANGEYHYFFGKDHLGGNTDPKILLVKINISKWTYGLTNGKMTLGQSYVDGPNLIFERN
ncbi:hypothetical protein [Tenacibaculum sp. UWU-22]|uniref:hypothetical protein n=1 Tax=Tenacibaculum sp. UWU-22 TaxID=3234187 RepID=UPI0034DB35AE